MAGSRTQYPGDASVARTIRIKAKSLARKLRASKEDRRDFEQQLWLRYLRAIESHDPSRSRVSTYFERVLTNEVLNIMDHWHTIKRSSERRAQRWDDPVGDEESLTWEGSYSQEQHFKEWGFGPRPASETRDLQTDVQWALRRLPPDLRKLAIRLMHASIAEVARQLGTPRATLYAKIRKIEEAFRAAGLDRDHWGTKSKKDAADPDNPRGSSCK